MIFKTKDKQLVRIKEKSFKLEKEIQKLFENNLFEIMGVELVKSEFNIKNKRIDSLAFDPQAKAFVIVEYKRDRNSSVVDQGFTYLNLMLQNKADFIVEYNENLKKNLKRDDVDWSQTRVAFVSPSFTENQREATNFKDLAIELWEVKRYEENIIIINPLKKSSVVSIKPTIQNKLEYAEVAKELKTYTEEDFLNNKSDDIIELYEKYKSGILNLADDIEIKPQKLYIAFKKDRRNIADIEIQNKSLKMFINLPKGQLDDPKNITRDVSNIGHWGNGDYELKITDDVLFEYIMSLVKQAII
jgi:predicted transport protein